MTGLQIGSAIAVIAVAFWLRRIMSIGRFARDMIVGVALLAALVLIGVISISVDPGRFVEIVGWLVGLFV